VARRTERYRQPRENYVRGMKPLNSPEDYAAAGWKEYRFHIIEKTLLNQVLIRIPVPSPEEWPKLLTGPRAQLAEFLRDEYFRYEKQARRRLILTRVFWFVLRQWEADDNYTEVFDFQLYRMFTRKGLKFGFTDPSKLDPANWYMDSNPKLAGGPGRFIPELNAAPFHIKWERDGHVALTRGITSEIICTKPPGDMLNEVWYALDIRKATVRDGLVVYPVIAKNKELIEVSKALQAHLQRKPA
jgi:hypothetical protein